VLVNCGGTPRAYDRGGSHAVVWDVAETDPGQFVQQHLVIGSSLVAWTSDRVAAYRLSDGQRVWQQLLPPGAGFLHDVAASGSSVVVAYDDRIRALSLTNGNQLWSRPGLLTTSLVIAGGWVYTHHDGAARQLALTNGTDGWTAAVPSVYRVVAADADTVYVWEAWFDFGPPSPSILHALRTSNGSERWQADVPSRVGSVAVTGDLVWVTSTGIFRQEHASDLIALKRTDGTQLTRFSWDDNMYGWTDVAFGAGKVVVDQGGSFGGPPRHLRVLGLAGPVPSIRDAVAPLAYVGTAYDHQLTAEGMGPFSWSLTSGTLPAGMSLSGSGLLSGTPTAAGTRRMRIQVTGSSGRAARRFLSVQAVQTSTPSWGSLARDASRNAFEPSVPSVDVDSAPSLGFRWKTSAPGTSATSYNDPVTFGDRLYDVGVDGVLRAWDTTGNATNRPPLWTAVPDTGDGQPQTYMGSPVVAGDRLIVFDVLGHLSAVRVSDGETLWRTAAPVPVAYTRGPLVVGTSILVITADGGVKAFSTTTGTALWGGSETSVADDFMSTTMSSDGTLAFAVTGCELYAIRLSNGTIAWHTPVSADPDISCDAFIDYSPPPVVAEGVVYTSTPWGLMSADAATGAVVTRIGVGARGSHVVVGGVWIFLRDERLYAVDPTSGDVLWKSSAVTSLGGLAASRDLVVAQTAYDQLVGLDRVTGEKVWEAVGSGVSTGTHPAIGNGRIFATMSQGVSAYGPL
jgi:outer membrane protein assembly factor BamB